jgi:hypothetical protein
MPITFSTAYKISQEGSTADYGLSSVSVAKQNIIKIVCNSPFRGDAISAVDPSWLILYAVENVIGIFFL